MLNTGNELKNLHELIKIQNIYIQQILPVIYYLAADSALIANNNFQKFITCFWEFTHHHYNAEGCSQTAQLAQVYQSFLWEKILDIQILSAAEQMELAIEYLEEATRTVEIQLQPQMMLLNQSMILLEETQLRIIERLEAIMAESQPAAKFQN
jgi:hypothetical protein